MKMLVCLLQINLCCGLYTKLNKSAGIPFRTMPRTQIKCLVLEMVYICMLQNDPSSKEFAPWKDKKTLCPVYTQI